MNKAVEIKNLTFAYNGINVLEDITLNIFEKDFIGIVGPNGGGKTTLLKLILGFIKPSGGSVAVYGKEPVKARTMIGYVPQYRETDKNFPIKTREVVEMGLTNRFTYFFKLSKDKREKTDKILKTVNLVEQADKPFGELSGGQQQRCMIGRALASDPKLLLLDEPTASVDNTVEQDIFDLLKQINKEKTIILVSHDIGFISSYVNRVACINKNLSCHDLNEISADKVIEKVYNENFSAIKHKCGL